jgi:deazaflavin-dependent oxidoreductase (nitroreductase family)
VKFLSRLHLVLYRLGLARRIVDLPVLVLTTTGRRSGKPRTVPLTYFEDDDDLVLVASYGGRPNDPDWFLNIQAEPEVEVTIGGERRRMNARRAMPEERARLWPLIVAGYRGYAAYQAKTTREIPLVLLSSHAD